MSWRTPENLSADGIATTLGFADAATMVAAINAGGTSILSGTAVPTTEGVDGDFYLRTTNTQFYGPKTAGAWGAGVSLIGATGATGDAGATGATGPAGPAPSGTGLVQVASGVASTLALGTALHGVRVNAAGTAYETAAISATDSTKLALDGSNAMTNRLQFSGTGTSAGSSVANIWRDSSGDINVNVATGSTIDFSVNSSGILRTSVYGIELAFAHSAPATSSLGIWRGSSTTVVVQGPTSGYAQMCCNGSNAPMVQVCGSSASGSGSMPGQINLIGGAVSLANAANRIVVNSATTKSGFIEISDTTNGRVALYSVENGVTTKLSGHSQFVAAAPGAGEVGVYLSSTNIIINNNSGGALLLGAQPRIF